MFAPCLGISEIYLSVGYLLLGMLSSLVFRAVRDALPDNPVAQERILGASLFAMAVADVRLVPVTQHNDPRMLKNWVRRQLST